MIVWFASRDLALLEMRWSTSSSPANSSEDETGRVRASEGCTSVSSSGVDITRVGAILNCSSSELCDSISGSASLLSPRLALLGSGHY